MIAIIPAVDVDAKALAAARAVLAELNTSASFLAAARIVARAPETFVLVGGDAAHVRPYTREVLPDGAVGVALYRTAVAAELTRRGLPRCAMQVHWWRLSVGRAQLLLAHPSVVLVTDVRREPAPVPAGDAP